MKMKRNMVMGGIGIALMAGFVMGCASPVATNGADALKQGGRAISLRGAPNLGSAATVAVFGGGAGVTNSGTLTQILGDLGTTGASTMITGFHSSAFSYTETPLNVGAVSGTVYTDAPQGNATDLAHAQAIAADSLIAFNDLAARPKGSDPGAGQLGGLTLPAGVYKSASGAFLLTGSDLTLDAQRDPNAVWIFQMASTLTVGTPSGPCSVILVNGAKASNVYWQVGSAATINGAGGGTMVGTIMARAGVTFSTAGNPAVTVLNGRALALYASITMVNTMVNATAANAGGVVSDGDKHDKDNDKKDSHKNDRGFGGDQKGGQDFRWDR